MLTYPVSPHLHPYFVCASSESSGESTRLDNAISTKMSCGASSNTLFCGCSNVIASVRCVLCDLPGNLCMES